MRKTAVLCAVLLLVVLLLFGCAKTEHDMLHDSWSTEINYVDELKSQLGDEGKYFKIDAFELDMSFTFKCDGTYAFELVEESFDTAVESIREPLRQGIREMFMPIATSLEASVDEYLDGLGLSVDSVVDEMVGSLDVAGFAEAVYTEGYYYLAEDRLYISSSKQVSLDPEVYYVFAQDDDERFVLTDLVGSDGGLLDFPAEFVRIG